VKDEKLKKYLKLFEEFSVDELEIDDNWWRGTRLKIVRNRQSPGNEPVSNMVVSSRAGSGIESSVGDESALTLTDEASSQEINSEEGHILRSPMVGTFYRAASPESEEFVTNGASVKSGQTLCIVEAMKIMNEIPADRSGTIEDILVENGQPVEYDQPLFRIRPD
jgi:acetyl-CoA carboxylase biotin carboxyl carrier protein